MNEVNFMPNIKLPEEHFEALCQIAKENAITAEQYAKKILVQYIQENYLHRG